MKTPINEERLQQVVDAIAAEEHAAFNMGHWVSREDAINHPCGTSACFAGHTALCADATPAWDMGKGMFSSYVLDDGEIVYIDEFMFDWLEISEDLQPDFYDLIDQTEFTKDQVFNQLEYLSDKHDFDLTIPKPW